MSKTFRYLSDVKLSDGLYWAEAIREGRWFYPTVSDDVNDDENYFEVDKPTLAEFKKNLDLGVKAGADKDLPINLSHEDGTDSGWIKAWKLGPSAKDPTKEALHIGFVPTKPEVKKDLDDETLKYVSSEIDLAWIDPEACAAGDCSPKKVFEGLGLTNHPYIKGMAPIQVPSPINLSEFPKSGCQCGGSGSCNCRSKETKTMKTLEELQAENEALTKQLAEAKKKPEPKTDAELKLAELEAERLKDRKELDEVRRQSQETRAELEVSNVKQKLLSLVRKGSLTVPLYKWALSFSETMIRGGSRTITLQSKVKRILLDEAGAEKEEEIDKVDVVNEVLGMLDNIPDFISTDPDKAELDETGPASTDDEDDKLQKEKDKVLAEAAKAGKPIDVFEAYKLAEKRLKGARK